MAEYKNPKPAADIVVEKEGKILLVKRKFEPFKGMWALPGGFMEYGETCEEAARREAREETGLDVELDFLIGVYSRPGRDPRFHTMSVAYAGHVVGGEAKAGDDAADAKWFSKIPEKMPFDHGEILGDYFRKKTANLV